MQQYDRSWERVVHNHKVMTGENVPAPTLYDISWARIMDRHDDMVSETMAKASKPEVSHITVETTATSSEAALAAVEHELDNGYASDSSDDEVTYDSSWDRVVGHQGAAPCPDHPPQEPSVSGGFGFGALASQLYRWASSAVEPTAAPETRTRSEQRRWHAMLTGLTAVMVCAEVWKHRVEDRGIDVEARAFDLTGTQMLLPIPESTEYLVRSLVLAMMASGLREQKRLRGHQARAVSSREL